MAGAAGGGRELDRQAQGPDRAEAMRLRPDFTLALYADLPYKNPDDLERFLDTLRKAGFSK